MKKIFLSLAAVSALGLAACQGSDDTNNVVENDAAVANEADGDVDAGNAAHNLLDSAGNTLEATGNTIENGAEATGNAVENVVE